MKPFDDYEDPIVGISLSGAHPKNSHVGSKKTPLFSLLATTKIINTTIDLCCVISKQERKLRMESLAYVFLMRRSKKNLLLSILMVVFMMKHGVFHL